MSNDWRRDVLICPKTGSRLSGTWPALVNSLGEPIEIDDIGIVQTSIRSGPGAEFHGLMKQGTTLRQLQHKSLHLAYWETPYYKNAIGSFLDGMTPVDKIAMDVGCGDGRFTEQLAELGYERIVGVDVNLRSLISLARYATEKGFRDRLLLIHASADQLPIREGVIDVALSIGVLYYLNERYECGLQAVTNALKPGGVLIASEPDLEGTSLKALLFEGLEDFILTLKGHRFTEVHDGKKSKFRLFTQNELRALYDRMGLKVIDYHGLSIFPSLLRIGMVRNRFDPEEIAVMEAKIREAFDYFDQNGKVYKHIIWRCRKKG